MALREKNFRQIIRKKEQKISFFSPKVLGDDCIIYASLLIWLKPMQTPLEPTNGKHFKRTFTFNKTLLI